MSVAAERPSCSGFYKGCFTVSERPVVSASPYKAEEDIFPPDPKALVKIIDDALIEFALLLQRAAFGQRQLDEDQVLAPADAEEVRS